MAHERPRALLVLVTNRWQVTSAVITSPAIILFRTQGRLIVKDSTPRAKHTHPGSGVMASSALTLAAYEISKKKVFGQTARIHNIDLGYFVSTTAGSSLAPAGTSAELAPVAL